jgi:hypothetical protein
VSALVREKIPFRIPILFQLAEPHQLKREEREVGGVLVTSGLEGFCPGVLIPLLAGDLTPSAGCAFGRIDEKRFIRHLSHLL